MTSKLIDGGNQRTYALVFESGDDAVEGLLRFAREQQITGAQVTAIGAFERVVLGFFEIGEKTYKKIPIHEQVELLSMVGNLGVNDQGAVVMHAHVVVGKRDGTAHGGHLLEAVVRPTLEAIVIESSRALRRRMRPEFGVPLLDLT